MNIFFCVASASKTDTVSADRISVASKAASALISKYNSLNSRKSNLAGPQSSASLAGLHPVRDKCTKSAVSPRAKTLRSVTDIIEEKIKQQKELEEEEQEDDEHRVKEKNSNSDQDCADGVGEKCTVSVEKVCTVSGQATSINSKTSHQNEVLCEETIETDTQMKVGDIASKARDLPPGVKQGKLDESSIRHLPEKKASLERDESSKAVSLVLSSGVDYKSALTKVIETCKDKLGIKNVEDLEENINDSDADEEGDGSEENKSSERKNNKPSGPDVDVVQSMQKPQEGSAEVVVEKERLPECESMESNDIAKSFTFLKPVTVSRTSDEGTETEKQASDRDPSTKTSSNKNVSVEINVGDKVCEKPTVENKEISDKGPETSQKVDVSGKDVPSVMKSVDAPSTTDKGMKPFNSDNANTNIRPITIDDDSNDKGEDSNEPSLLMEVESEPEQELENDQLIIDLEEDDLELREDKTIKKNMPPSEKSKSVSIVKELSPSPMLRKAVQTDEKIWPGQNERGMQKQNSNFILPSSSSLVSSKPSSLGQNSNKETLSRSGQCMQLPVEESNG